MVHKAIELWLFADNLRLIPFLETAVLSAGLASPEQRVEAIRRTMELLKRLRAYPIWDEINSCQERYHEVPYSHMVGERAETGYIDLLYLASNGWQVIDFKTDSIHSVKAMEELIEQYSRQMHRYFSAVEMLLGQPVQVRICFLDNEGRVETVLL